MKNSSTIIIANELSAMMIKLAPLIFLIGPISLVAAIIFAFQFYGQHVRWIDPSRHGKANSFVADVTISGLIGGLFGFSISCSSQESNNLCGLWGLLVTGPILSALAIFFAARSYSKR